MEKTVVDFSKLPEKVLEEYEIEVFDSYKDVFYSLYLDDESFSPYSLIDTLGDKSIPEFISNEPYLYECGNKLYRWVYATEYMDELAAKYPDAVVSGRFNNKEDDKGMTAKGALKILSYNNAKLALDLCGYGQVISDEQLDELKNVIISALQAQADKENNATILSYVEQAALFIKKNSGVAWEIFKLIEKENHREDIIGKLEEHGLTDIPDVEIDRLVETFESALSKNDGYYEAFWASADNVIENFIQTKNAKKDFSAGIAVPPTLDELVREYEHFTEVTKGIRTVEQARAFQEQHHIEVEINGERIDDFIKSGEEEIKWIRYEFFGHLWYIYDRFDGEPEFDVYYGEYGDDLLVENVTIDYLKENFSQIVEDNVMRDISLSSLCGVGRGGGENFGYTVPGGKHHIYIYFDDSITHADESKTVEDGYYVIEPNRVVDGAMEPMGDTVTADYGDFEELRKGIQWCFEQFEADKDVSLDSVLNDAVVRSEDEQKSSLGEHKIKDASDLIM